MESIGSLWLYVSFFGLVTVMLLVDFLGFKQKQLNLFSLYEAVQPFPNETYPNYLL